MLFTEFPRRGRGGCAPVNEFPARGMGRAVIGDFKVRLRDFKMSPHVGIAPISANDVSRAPQNGLNFPFFNVIMHQSTKVTTGGAHAGIADVVYIRYLYVTPGPTGKR